MTDPLLRLDAATTAVVLIDVQEKLLPLVIDPDATVAATRLVLRAADVLALPVVLTTQYQAALGATVARVAELVPARAARLDKTAFSCFDDERFAALLAAAAPGAKTLLVAGIEAHICVLGTVLGALRNGFSVAVLCDAVSGRGSRDRDLAFRRMERAGALLTTSETAVYEMLRGSGGAAFKAMLPWFKSGA
jgi:nicotinamidase-related amidase